MIKNRYINLFTDFGFKRVFGQEANKDLLIDFLNQVLPEAYTIEDLSYSKNEQLGEQEEDRKAVFDLHCKSVNNEYFIVELQKAKQDFFKDRSLYYTTFPIVEQAKKGNWNYRLDPIFMVGILNFSFDTSSADEIRHHVMLKDQNCEVFFNKLHFIYLEVVKFTKNLQECTTQFERWLWIFKNLPNLDKIPEELVNSMFVKVFQIAEVAKFSPTEQEAYQQSLKYYWDLHNVIDTAKKEGIEEQKAIADKEIAAAKLREEKERRLKEEAKLREQEERRLKEEAKLRVQEERKLKEEERRLKEEAKSREEEAKLREKAANLKLAKRMLKDNEPISEIIKETGLSEKEILNL